MVQQLNFPQDFVLAPQLPDLSQLQLGNGLDQVYVITSTQRLQRYKYVKAWSAGLTGVTVWPGLIYDEMSWQQRDRVQMVDTHGPDRAEATFNHLSVWRDALAKGYQRILVLEDDVVLSRDFSQRLNQVIAQLNGLAIKPQESNNDLIDGDIVYLNDGIVTLPEKFHADPRDHPEVAPGLFLRPTGDSRCAASYLINAKALAAAVTDSIEIPVDHYLNRVGRELTVLWLEPTIATQGSMRGLE